MKLVFLLLTIAFVLPAAAQNVADNSKPPVPPADAASTNAGAKPVVEPLNAARALLNSLKFTEAATAFRAILEKEPSSAEAHAGLVLSLLHARQLDEARAAVAKALASAPASAVVHAVAGDVNFRDGQFGDSEKEYRAAIKLDANCARAQYGMGRMYHMVSMNRKAKESFTRAHQLDPSDGQITDAWLRTLPYSERLEEQKKLVGTYPGDYEKREIEFLTAVAGKKTWHLVSEIKPTEIKMLPYGSSQAFAYTGHSEGISNIHKGFGLNVKFNDRVSADILLDTGASGLVIGRRLAEKIGVKKITDSYFGGIGDKGPVAGYVGWVDKIRIGNVEFENCLVNVSSRSDIVDESGLIGADVFDKFLITLDFREWKMLLNPLPKNPNAASPDDQWQDRYIAPEMQSFTKFYAFGSDIIVPVVVNDKALGNFILDTGADLNSLNAKFAAQVTKASADGEFMIRGVSGKAENVLTGKKAIMQFAKMRLESHDLPVLSTDTISSAEGTEIAGFIGIRSLVQMKMTIDYRDGLINLEVYEFQKARE